jgi:hypothetical protein
VGFVAQRSVSRLQEVLWLFVIALVGLALNSAVVWLLAEILRVNPTLAKILAMLPILGWNYLGRRAIVLDGTPAAARVTIAERVRQVNREDLASRFSRSGVRSG